MRRYRAFYLSMLILSFVFVYNYGGKVPYFLFYVCIALPLFSGAYLLLVLINFKYVQIIDRRVAVKGDIVQYTLIVSNEGILFYPYVKFVFEEKNEFMFRQLSGAESATFSIFPYSKVGFNFSFQCKYRGIYALSLKEIIFEDFLRIFKMKYKIKEIPVLKVYPRILQELALQRFSSSAHETYRGEQLMTDEKYIFADIRKYSYGDSIRDIHWKITAKKMELMVKEHQGFEDTDLNLLLDLSDTGYAEEYKIAVEDRIIECAVSIIHNCLANNLTTGVLFFKEDLQHVQVRNMKAFDQIYDILAFVDFDSKINAEELLKIISEGSVKTAKHTMLLTSNISYSLCEALYKLNLSGIRISLVYVDALRCLQENKATKLKNQEKQEIIDYLMEKGIGIINM